MSKASPKKKPVPRKAPSANKQALGLWVKSMVNGMARGGSKRAADTLGISPSGMSKLINDPQRGFDEKTLRAYTWMSTSKSEAFDPILHPVLESAEAGPIVVELRQAIDGQENFYTWRVKKAKS